MFARQARSRLPARGYSTGAPSVLVENPVPSAILQPHVHPSSGATQPRSSKLVPYGKSRPIAIPPFTLPFSPSPYARSAWLIPVRGGFPWDRCTPAIMLRSPHGIPAGPDPNIDGAIAWTHSSLQSFWAFLLQVREKRTAGVIGVSFHASRDEAQISRLTQTPASAALEHGNQHATAGSHVTLNAATIPTALPTDRALLSSVDYIKVYHEAPNAMHLRNLFHLWSYVASCDSEPQVQVKVRILKGARLALVDERSRGMLIS
ncbi:hypothetical protein FPV67DRAFT_261350 [Lyophyllum atratum]|nr:hypothetical protein FPV67DRAFT_261350 [Lyophyllum atratum]